MINKKQNSTYVLGDSHGNFSAVNHWLANFANKGDVIVSVGDFGSMVNEKKLYALGSRLENSNCKCLVNRGNHSIPAFHEESRSFGNGALKFMPDYSVEEINERNYLFLGGAISVDRIDRTEGRDWWRGEGFQFNERKLKSFTNIDYVISHTTPMFAAPFPVGSGGFVKHFVNKGDKNLPKVLIKEGKEMERAYEILSERNDIKVFYAGHWHQTHRHEQGKTLFRVLDINEIVSTIP